MSGAAAQESPRFAERGFNLLERIDYRLAETLEEKEAICRLR